MNRDTIFSQYGLDWEVDVS